MEPHNQGSLGGGTRWRGQEVRRYEVGTLGVGAMGPRLGLWMRPIRGGAGSNVIRGWCGRGLVGVRVRVRVCGVGGLNKVGVS